MSIIKLIKRTQISLFATFGLMFFVAALTLIANKQIDQHKQSSEDPTQVAGGSATGNAIENHREQSPQPRTVASPTEIAQAPFDHLFQGEDFITKNLYRSGLTRDLDISINDTISPDSLLNRISQFRSDHPTQEITIGTSSPQGFVVTGPLSLRGLNNLMIIGMHISTTDQTALNIVDSREIEILSAHLTSTQGTAVEVKQSEKIHLSELLIHHSQLAIRAIDKDFSSEDEPFMTISKSVIHHNKTAIDIQSAYGVELRQNFIAHNGASIKIQQDNAVLMHLPSALDGYKNVFYKSPVKLDSNFTQEFADLNVTQDGEDYAKLKKIAWFWLPH